MTRRKKIIPMSNAVILLSGGLDCTVALAAVRNNYDEMLALTFDYGQKSVKEEIKSAAVISEYYKIRHKTIVIDWLKKISSSSLTSDENIVQITKDELDNRDVTQKSADSVWIPNRNALFVNIAACFAESLNYNTIIIGANKEEGATFKDNTPEFVESINIALKYSANNNIKLIAPLINMNKKEIVEICNNLKVPLNLIYSCYISGDKHCGKCESCLRLKRALELNNRHDIIKEIF